MTEFPSLRLEFCRKFDGLIGIEHLESVENLITSYPGEGDVLAKTPCENGELIIRCQHIALPDKPEIYIAYATPQGHDRILLLRASNSIEELRRIFGGETEKSRAGLQKFLSRVGGLLGLGGVKWMMDKLSDGF